MTAVKSSSLRNLSKVLTLVIPFTIHAIAYAAPQNGIRSNSEGAISSQHLQNLNVYRQKYFYNSQGKIDLIKLQSLSDFLNTQKDQLKNSAKLGKKTNLILAHGYEEEAAEKQGLEALNEEAEALAPVLFALEHIEDLKKNLSEMSDAAIHEKVETILLFVAAGYTVYPEGLFTKAIDRGKGLLRNFFDFKIDDRGQMPASNLLDPQTNAFLTSHEIKKLQTEGKDISKLNPPSSAFWTNNDVESYDPYNEVFWGKKLFPDSSIEVPVFHYKRMGNGNIKIKTEWYDENDLNDNGKPKKKDVTMRVGHETHVTQITSHLARIVGYPANPNTFRKKVKLELGDTNYEQFVAEWQQAHTLEQGSPLTHVERIPGENAVYVKSVSLEAYPKEELYRKMGPFRMGDNGFGNRREYRALVLFYSLIGLEDQFEYQTRVDAYRENKKSSWQPLFYMSDMGQAMALPTWGNTGYADEYLWKFTWTNDNEIHLFWASIFDSRTWEKTTYSDIKWLARRMAKMKSSQIEAIMKSSGLPEPVAVLYAEKVKSRLNKMMQDFKLDQEGFPQHQVKNKEELSRLYPKYISKHGFLKEGIQQIEGNTAPLLGDRFTIFQTIKKAIYNTFSERLTDLITQEVLTEKLTTGGLAEFDLGRIHGETGKIFEANRNVSVNHEVGPDQRRYVIKDKLSLGLPIGMYNQSIKTPMYLYYVFTFEYTYSVDKLIETSTKRFFDKLNPFELSDIKENLLRGEQLYISHSYGGSIGDARIKLLDQLGVEAALIGLNKSTLKTLYFAKSDQLLEVYVTDLTDKGFKTGFDIQAAVRAALMYQNTKSTGSQSYYKIDMMDQEKTKALNKAFELALLENNFDQLNAQVKPLKVEQKSKTSYLTAGLFLWSRDSSTTVSEITLDQKTILLAGKKISRDRAFDRLWNDKKSGVGIDVLNFAGNLTNEDESMDIAFEGSLNDQKNQFTRFEVNLSFSKADKYTKRKEFYKDLVKYFNDRSGEAKYIDFVVPSEIEQYLDMSGLMRWQLSSSAVIDLMKAIANKDNLGHINIAHNQQRHTVNRRDQLALQARKVLTVLEDKKTQSVKDLQKTAKKAVQVVEEFIGSKGQHAALIRKHVNDKDIWIVTKLEDLLDYSHPTFRPRNDYWAPEVGKFQGHSDLNVFRRTRLQNPILVD